MKQKDHKALAHYLLDNVGGGLLWEKSWHRRLFLLGCVSPDYIPFTYLRGFRQSHAMLGHNARYSGEHIRKSIHRLQMRGVRRYRDCFRLGTLMHYLADSFTFPHTEGFAGNMRAHRRYENDLHGCFEKFLSREPSGLAVVAYSPEKLTDFLRNGRLEYERGECSCDRDCRQILNACTSVFQTLCFGQ